MTRASAGLGVNDYGFRHVDTSVFRVGRIISFSMLNKNTTNRQPLNHYALVHNLRLRESARSAGTAVAA